VTALTDSETLAYRPREAARILGCSRSRIYELLAAGEIRGHKLGANTLIPRTELEAFLSSLPEWEPDSEPTPDEAA
jgi:excisionase family DNA binding protein